ncbi:hypothetical protein CCR91_20915 [Thiorhodovibrio winogradskyi]|nr:hypothetical protein [Thiorhodovibrio winogradskyi]
MVLMAVGFAYEQGVTGDLFYDDRGFLGPLAEIETFDQAWTFVTTGDGGPLGRPLALLSFLPHASDWSDSSIDARRVNVLIHLTNGLLLFVIGYMILKLRGQGTDRTAYWTALMAALLWLSMPLLVSTTLTTVQRWTSLAMLFGLSGLAVFVYGYFLQQCHPKRALTIQASALGIGTLLALFTKESGALIPVYALVIDAVLLKTLPAPKPAIWLRRGALGVGLLALLWYLSPLHLDWFAYSDYRGWSSWDRVQTEVVILWDYLYRAIFPQPTAFSPFHDDVELVQGWLLPSLALAGFVVLTALAYAIRKRTPWPLFALLWFFTGHLIESTVVQLELVFDHRNYLAIYGCCLALAALVWQLPKRYVRLGQVLLSIYALMLYGILYATTSLWGNTLEAVENWTKRHPSSARAILHLSTAYYEALGTTSYSLYSLDRLMDGCPGCLDVQMQALLYACGETDEPDIRRRYQKILETAKDGRYSHAFMDSLYAFQIVIADNRCRPLTAADAYQLPLIFSKNPNCRTLPCKAKILFQSAFFAKEAGDFAAAHEHLQKAEALTPSTMPILQLQVNVLLDEKRYEDALVLIERRRLVPWRDDSMSDALLDEMAAAVREEAAQVQAPVSALPDDS